MNREAAEKLWPIIKAFGEGEMLQWKPWKGWPWKDLFSDEADMAVNFDSGTEFRIKPKPREVVIAYVPGNPWLWISNDATYPGIVDLPLNVNMRDVVFKKVELPE